MSDDKDWKVQQTAVAALGDIGDGRSVEPLVAAIKHEDDDGRSLVIDIGGFTTDFLAINQGGQRLYPCVQDVEEAATLFSNRLADTCQRLETRTLTTP